MPCTVAINFVTYFTNSDTAVLLMKFTDYRNVTRRFFYTDRLLRGSSVILSCTLLKLTYHFYTYTWFSMALNPYAFFNIWKASFLETAFNTHTFIADLCPVVIFTYRSKQNIYIRPLSSVQNKLRFIVHFAWTVAPFVTLGGRSLGENMHYCASSIYFFKRKTNPFRYQI